MSGDRGCADSRVAPELVFESGGRRSVRSARGRNVVSGTGPLLKGILEYAVASLGVRLIRVPGHSRFGAVRAIEHPRPPMTAGSIGELVGSDSTLP